MNVFTNEDYFKAQLRKARRLQLIGIACIVSFLLFAFALNFNLVTLAPEVLIVVYFSGYVFVLIGFPVWLIGNNKLKRLEIKPRSDQLLNAELKGLSNKYTLHHYAPVDGGTIKHLMVTPAGLIVMESRDEVGRVSCTGAGEKDKWKLPGGFFGGLTSDGLSSNNPTADLDAVMARADGLLTSIGKPNVPVNGFIVFTRLEDFEVNACNRRSIPLNETKALVKAIVAETEGGREGSIKVDELLTTEDRRRLNEMIAPKQPPAPTKPAAQSKASQPRQ